MSDIDNFSDEIIKERFNKTTILCKYCGVTIPLSHNSDHQQYFVHSSYANKSLDNFYNKDYPYIEIHFVNRFREIEYNLQIIIDNLIRVSEGEEPIEAEIQQLADFSDYLYNSYLLLKIYLEYKLKMTILKTPDEKDVARHTAISEIEVLEAHMEDDGRTGAMGYNWDISMLAKNFFAARLSKKVEHEYLGKL